jgi:hypothetical protein
MTHGSSRRSGVREQRRKKIDRYRDEAAALRTVPFPQKQSKR